MIKNYVKIDIKSALYL